MIHSVVIFFLCSIFLSIHIEANPFLISFPAKKKPSIGDYIHIQKQLRSINITPTLIQLNDESNQFPPGKFWGRCASGIYLGLIEPEKGHLPIHRLEKIGNGGEMCIVSYASYNREYPHLIKSIPEALEKCGFNGYFLYRIGGYPNPTGQEIQYVGIPYAFKIFMMVEAHQLGFDNVLWIDSSMLPLRDPSPLFDWIDRRGGLYYGWKACPDAWTWIYPSTSQILKDLTGTDVFNATYVRGAFFGLKMDTEKAKQLIELYYRCVDLGTPFLSCYPDEFVLTAIIGKVAPEWDPFPFWEIYGSGDDTFTSIEQKKKEGIYFYYRQH
jgi:hypothetical protein